MGVQESMVPPETLIPAGVFIRRAGGISALHAGISNELQIHSGVRLISRYAETSNTKTSSFPKNILILKQHQGFLLFGLKFI